MQPIILGSDFEVFIYQKGQLVECDKVFSKYTKHSPLDLNGYLITHDRKSLECAIPCFEFDAKDPLQFFKEVKKGLDILEKFCKSIDTSYEIVLKDFIELQEIHEWHKGLEWNIYHKVDNSEPIRNNIVTNGLHIHFSGIKNREKLIKKLDRSLGIFYKVKYFFSKRSDYGQLGAFRPKSYDIFTEGFEYRVLGGNMLKDSNLHFTSINLNKILKK